MAFLERGLLLLLCGTMLCCTPEEPQITWDPLDYEHLRRKADNPTGTLVADSVTQTQSRIADASGISTETLDRIFALFRSVHDAFTPLLTALSRNERSQSLRDDNATAAAGTRVQLRLSCPGPDLADPNTQFTAGQIRILGVTGALSDFAENTFSLNGHLLMHFETCVIGETTIDGQSPAVFDDENDIIAMEFNAHIDFGDEEITFTHAILLSTTGYILLIDNPEHGSYTFIVESDVEDRLVLRTAEADYGCTTTDAQWMCEILER